MAGDLAVNGADCDLVVVDRDAESEFLGLRGGRGSEPRGVIPSTFGTMEDVCRAGERDLTGVPSRGPNHDIIAIDRYASSERRLVVNRQASCCVPGGALSPEHRYSSKGRGRLEGGPIGHHNRVTADRDTQVSSEVTEIARIGRWEAWPVESTFRAHDERRTRPLHRRSRRSSQKARRQLLCRG